jgi:NAD(P)H-hydrate epimerase
VDAIFGTGFKGAPRGRAAEMIAMINASSALRKTPVFAIDVPSGVDATTGEVAGEAARDDHDRRRRRPGVLSGKENWAALGDRH